MLALSECSRMSVEDLVPPDPAACANDRPSDMPEHKPDLEWIIEHDDLPAGDLGDPAGVPAAHGVARLPTWVWLLVGLSALVLGILIPLWMLGGREDRSPDRETLLPPLEAAVQLEISALLAGDWEILAGLQEPEEPLSAIQPPAASWFAARERAAGNIELVSIELIDAESARVEVKLFWDGLPYRLFWSYRLVDARWLHSEPLLGNADRTGQLDTPHLSISHQPEERVQALGLVDRLEPMLAEICRLALCREQPFKA